MSDQHSDTQNSSNNKSQQRKKGLSIFILLLLLIAIGSAAYWYLFIKGFEETEDAYVSGNQVMVSAQVAGNIAKINVDNMDPVQAGDVLLELDDTNAKLSFRSEERRVGKECRARWGR